MKILIYAHHFPPAQGGMEFSNLEVARGLHNLGHTVQVIACRNPGIEDLISTLSFPVYLLPKWLSCKTYSLCEKARANWVFYPYYLAVFRQGVKNLKPDITLVSDETSNCFWGTIANRMEVPYVSYCSVPFIAVSGKPGRFGTLSKIKFFIDETIQNQFKKYIINSYRNARRLIAVSHSTKHELINIVPGLANKIVIIPRSIDDCFFKEPVNTTSIDKLRRKFDIDRHNFVLLSVSTLDMGKGIDDVLQAIRGLEPHTLETIKYVIVGAGRAELRLRELTHVLELKNKVVFTGAIPHDELLSYYDLCDLFVLPSRRGKEESFGRVFVEAAARSKASVGVNEGGMADVIDHKQTGFLLSPGNIEMLRDTISYLAHNPEQARILGATARAKAERTYRSYAVALQFERHLREAVESD